MRITDEQAEEIVYEISEGNTPAQLVIAVEKVKRWASRCTSYSDIIKENNKYQKHCPTCDKSYTIWKCNFPVLMLRALRMLHDHGQPMTVREIEESFERSWDERQNFAKLRHWGLIKKVGENKYRTTEEAGMLFSRIKRVREHLWIFQDEVVQPPLDEGHAPLAYFNDLKHSKVPIEEIIGESVSEFENPPVPAEQPALL